MYLRHLLIKRFRCIHDLALVFRPGLNVLIGENNSGKTAIIDALRLCFSYGSQQRELYVSPADFWVDAEAPSRDPEDIEFHLRFEIEADTEAGVFNDLLVITDEGQELQLHFKYFLDTSRGQERVRVRVWGGQNEGQAIAPQIVDLLYFVHLGALRDAVHQLRPVRGNRLGELFFNLETDSEKRTKMAGTIHDTLAADADWQALLTRGSDRVNGHLDALTISTDFHPICIDFVPPEFRRIVDTLRVQTDINSKLESAVVGRRYLDLQQNGLGYNNLIYTAVVLGDLRRRKELEEAACITLLIEEPEAHLHPQLQDTFFKYLSGLDPKDFQVVITSHSPTITAKADLGALIILHQQDHRQHAFRLEQAELDMDNIKYLQKFLDVTKSQLFFAKGVIFVEGISEALLLPVFSEVIDQRLVLSRAGVEVVNMGGVAFEHFGRIFNGEDPAKRLNRRAVILTDDDCDEHGVESPRARNAKTLARGCLRVELARHTFEHELFCAGSNCDLLLELFEAMHPHMCLKIKSAMTKVESAERFVEALRTTKAKSELAHRLSVRLGDDKSAREQFVVPDYIKRGIEWVVLGV